MELIPRNVEAPTLCIILGYRNRTNERFMQDGKKKKHSKLLTQQEIVTKKKKKIFQVASLQLYIRKLFQFS